MVVWILWTFKILLWVVIGYSAAMHPTVSSGRFQWPSVGGYRQWWITLAITLALVTLDSVGWYVLMNYIRSYQVTALTWPTQWQWPLLLTLLGGVAALGILQLLHILDFTHYSRHSAADYELWKARMLDPSWEEQYIQEHPGSWIACGCALLFTCRSSWRYTWPYIAWALLWRLAYMLALPYVLTWSWVGQWMAMADAMPLPWMVLGFLLGRMGERHMRRWAQNHPMAYRQYMMAHHTLVALGIAVTLWGGWLILRSH